MNDRPYDAPFATHLPVGLVLGAAVWPGGRPSPTLARRARHAADLHTAGRISHVIACGGVGQHPPSEAEVIAAILHDAGVPPAAIHLEPASTNTLENIAFAREILARLGARQVAIVTDAYHLPRARMIARRLGLSCALLPPPPAPALTARRVATILREIPAWVWWRLRPLPVSARRGAASPR